MLLAIRLSRFRESFLELLLAAAFLRDYGYAIDQELGAGDDHFISGLYAIEDDIVVADDLADLERLLVDYVSTSLVRLSDESEIEAADSGYGNDWNHGFFLAAPDHTGSDKLGGAQAVVRVCYGCFGKHGLGRGIHLRRDEGDATGGKRSSCGVDDLDGKIHFQLSRLFDGNIDIGLEATGAVDGGEHGGGNDAVPDADGNIADDSGARSIDFVVVQLDLLFADLSAKRLQLGLSGVEVGAGLVEILFADYSGIGEAADAVVILLRPFDLSDLRGGCALLAFNRRLLFGGIDLHHGGAGGYAFTRVDEDLGDNAFDLRHDDGGVARFQGGDVVGGVVDFLGGGGLDRDGHGLRGGGFGFGFFALAAGGNNKERGQKGGGQNQKWRFCKGHRHIVALSEIPQLAEK
jgi:hypothetical protein